MRTEPIQDYILKSEHNLRIAAAVGEAWPDAREKLVSVFLDRLEARLKKKLKGFDFIRDGRFFVDAYPGYYLWKPAWKQYNLGLQCHEYGERMLFGVEREKQYVGKGSFSDELLDAVRKVHPSARMNAWWVVRIVMSVPAADWRKPEVLWQMHKDARFLDSVAEQLLEVATISAPILDRWERKK
jgi:hypothetical protein